MLSKEEKAQIQRHSAIIEQYELLETEERRRLAEPTAARLKELFDKSHQAVGPADAFGIFQSRGFSSEEHQEVFAVHNKIERGIGEFAQARKPAITPWDTPSLILDAIKLKLATLDAVNRYFDGNHPHKEADNDAEIRKLYREARERILSFVPLARSVLHDFPEAIDPYIGLQDICAWCEDSLREQAAAPATPTGAANVIEVHTDRISEAFVLGPRQKSIMERLSGRAMRTRALAKELHIDQPSLYKRDGIKELKDKGLVKLHSKIGYYRPDAPPPELSDTPDDG